MVHGEALLVTLTHFGEDVDPVLGLHTVVSLDVQCTLWLDNLEHLSTENGIRGCEPNRYQAICLASRRFYHWARYRRRWDDECPGGRFLRLRCAGWWWGTLPTAEVDKEEEGQPVGVGTGLSLTFFIRKDSSSSLSTAKMFSMGMLQRG